MSDIVTPQQVERRLIQLGKELDEAHRENVEAEQAFYTAKGAYEIGIAKARMAVGTKYADAGIKATVQEREDRATIETSELLSALYIAEAQVKAARANVNRVRSQIDITRSIAANVRTTMEAA